MNAASWLEKFCALSVGGALVCSQSVNDPFVGEVAPRNRWGHNVTYTMLIECHSVSRRWEWLKCPLHLPTPAATRLEVAVLQFRLMSGAWCDLIGS